MGEGSHLILYFSDINHWFNKQTGENGQICAENFFQSQAEKDNYYKVSLICGI